MVWPRKVNLSTKADSVKPKSVKICFSCGVIVPFNLPSLVDICLDVFELIILVYNVPDRP